MVYEKKHGEGGNSQGEGRTKLYMVWSGIRARCRDPKHVSYGNYGRKGIMVCKEWDDYKVFRRWAIENGYSEGLWIDRIDSRGHYEPTNCRWITPQANVRRTKRTYLAFGESKTMIEWFEDERCAVTYYTLRNRLQRGWDVEEAITTETSSRRKLPARTWTGTKIKGREELRPRIESLR